MSEETKPEVQVMCPNCGSLFPQTYYIPTHDFPKPTRQVCKGSGQAPRRPDDTRRLWNGKYNPNLDSAKKPSSDFRDTEVFDVPPVTAKEIEALGITVAHASPASFSCGLPGAPWEISFVRIPKTVKRAQLALFCQALGIKPKKEGDDG